MAGINPKLPNLKLQNLQMNATAKVDAKAPEKTTGDARTLAVWFTDDLREDNWGPTDYKVGDVITNGRLNVIIVAINPDGSIKSVPCGVEAFENAMEEHRGDIRK